MARMYLYLRLQFLVNASNTELYGLAAGATVVGALGGWAAGPGAAALGMGSLGVSITAGAGAGAAEYLGWTLGAQALAGGNAPGPNMGGLIEFTAAGAIGGAIFHGLGKLGGKQFDALTSTNCFVAGTPVVIGEASVIAFADIQQSADGFELGNENWSSLLLAGTAFGVAVVGHRRLTRRNRREEEQSRGNFFDGASLDDILDKLWFPERPRSMVCRNLDASSPDLKPHSGGGGSQEAGDIESERGGELMHSEDQAMRTDVFGAAVPRHSGVEKYRRATARDLSNHTISHPRPKRCFWNRKHGHCYLLVSDIANAPSSPPREPSGGGNRRGEFPLSCPTLLLFCSRG